MAYYHIKDEYRYVQYVKRNLTCEEYEKLKTLISDEVEMYELAEGEYPKPSEADSSV